MEAKQPWYQPYLAVTISLKSLLRLLWRFWGWYQHSVCSLALLSWSQMAPCRQLSTGRRWGSSPEEECSFSFHIFIYIWYMIIYYVIPDGVFPISRFITKLCINRGRISPTHSTSTKKRREGVHNDHQSIKPWLCNQWFELQHHNFSGQVIEVTLILPFHKQARAQMRCKRSKWSSNFKWPQPNYVSTSCFSISLYLWNSPSNACELSVLDNWVNWKIR